MFFDLEAVLAIVHNIVSVWRVRTQLVSYFILSGLPEAGAEHPWGVWNGVFSPVL